MGIATLAIFYHLAVAGGLINWLGLFMPAQMHRAISLAFGLIMIYLLYNWRDQEEFGLKWYDAILLLSALISLGYIIFFYDQVIEYYSIGKLDTKGIVLTAMLWVPLLEALRRKVGFTLPILVIAMVLITVFQKHLPGILSGAGYPIERLFFGSYVGVNGIFGMTLGIAATIIIIFIFFGALLELAGAGKWFMDLAMALTGWSKGGPAKVAVVSSAFFGSISGSPSSNVATTGAVTIPLMKKSGYSAKFAAATESVASTGGNILPPVMGATAFLMAEWIGVTYGEIIIAALIPALLYYFVTFMSVHFQAYRSGVQTISIGNLPNLWSIFKSGWFYLIPMAVLVYVLVFLKYPPTLAGILAVPFVIGVSFLAKDRDLWITPIKFMQACYMTIKRWLVVLAICGSVGIFVGALSLSGLGNKFSRFLLDVADERLIILLIFIGICSLILGMGMDAMPAYITLATLLAPAVIALGVPDLSAHLFVIYWGLASFITPPVCVAVYVAIGISGSKVWETGWEAVKIGMACYLVPYAFILNPELVMMGEPVDIVMKVIVMAIGCIYLAAGFQGYGLTPLNLIERVILVATGIAVVTPNVWVELVAIIIGAIVMLRKRVFTRMIQKPQVQSQ
jgi:TRAP transporter 4TM/12TM fusion protein